MPSGPNARWPPLWFENGCSMNALPSPHTRSRRDSAAATNGSSARRSKRATTLWPAGFVKLTKTRPDAADIRRKGQAQQTAFPTRADRIAQVQERGVADGAVREHVDAAVLRDEQERPGMRRVLDEGDGALATLRYRRERIVLRFTRELCGAAVIRRA